MIIAITPSTCHICRPIGMLYNPSEVGCKRYVALVLVITW
jgi:hypothetical protein